MQKPSKIGDDICDAIKSTIALFGADPTELTHNELIEEQMSPQNRMENLSKQYGQDGFGVQMVARHQEQRQIENRLAEERKEEDERLRAAFGSGKRVRILGKRR